MGGPARLPIVLPWSMAPVVKVRRAAVSCRPFRPKHVAYKNVSRRRCRSCALSVAAVGYGRALPPAENPLVALQLHHAGRRWRQTR